MATDVARISFDRARRYTGVVPQQGRVLLEAEQNEQRRIDDEDQREITLDFVGPAGTPDDGYAVSQGELPELIVQPGTMYVGGLRVMLDEPLSTDRQPDWLDRPADAEDLRGREHVLLTITETDVTAVEDPALLEVALGGPDGAARTRLLQRIVRNRTNSATCADALLIDEKQWAGDGLIFDRESMRLHSRSRLLVTWQDGDNAADPCEPTTTGGYLGAENQCIRVQLTAVGPDGGFELLWGYDDASFLYRVTPDASANPVLTLDRSPVDDFHRPRAGQAVQVLRSTAELACSDGVVEGLVAAQSGEVGVLIAPYNPDIRTVQFPNPLPANYDSDPQLFLRVWQEQLRGEQGRALALGASGVEVTITSDSGILHEGDFWCIGVRPETPTTVFPARYLRTPQPPDGPRTWVCPLAVLEWTHRELVILDDCRNHFDSLTELEREGGCCTLTVQPEDAPRLQDLIDAAAANRDIKERAQRVTVCFARGRYELNEPLVLRERHSNLELRGCGAAVIAVHPEVERRRGERFQQGLFVLLEADGVSVTGFEFELPLVPLTLPAINGVTGGAFDDAAVGALNALERGLWASVGIRPINCAVFEVADCVFRYVLGEDRDEREQRNVFGVGVFAGGAMWGLRLIGNRFLHDPFEAVRERGGAVRILAGYLHSQMALARNSKRAAALSVGASRLPALLDDADVSGNRFAGLTVPLLVVADLGQTTLHNNQVEDCYGGFWIVEAAALATNDLPARYKVAAAGEPRDAANSALVSGLIDPIFSVTLLLSSLFPLPGDLVKPKGFIALPAAKTPSFFAAAAKISAERTAALIERMRAERTDGGEDTKTAPADAEPSPKPVTRSPARPITTIDPGEVGVNVSGLFPPPQEPSAILTMIPVSVTIGIVGGFGRLEAIREAERVGLRMTLSVASNVIECDGPGAARGAAFFLFTSAPKEGPVNSGDADAAMLTGNRLVSREATFAAVVVGPDTVTLTGNVVGGTRGGRGAALAVSGAGAAAITGNVVSGSAVLPENRPFPAPLNTWRPFNTIG